MGTCGKVLIMLQSMSFSFSIKTKVLKWLSLRATLELSLYLCEAFQIKDDEICLINGSLKFSDELRSTVVSRHH